MLIKNYVPVPVAYVKVNPGRHLNNVTDAEVVA